MTLPTALDDILRSLQATGDLVDDLTSERDLLLQRLADCEAAPPPPTTPPADPDAMPTYVPSGWKVALAEDFAIDCPKGQFAAVYGPRRIGFYPDTYKTTRHKQGRSTGMYSGAHISVADGICTQHMFVDSSGKSTCSALVPIAVPAGGKWGDAPGMIIQQRVRFEYEPSFKSAHLLWPLSDRSTRPTAEGGGDGEIDFVEFEGGQSIDVFIHHQGATTGSDQKWIPTSTDPRQWNTIEHVWVMGRSCTQIHNGVVAASPYLTRIPATPMHCVLQNEEVLSSGSVITPGDEGFIYTKWIRVLVPV